MIRALTLAALVPTTVPHPLDGCAPPGLDPPTLTVRPQGSRGEPGPLLRLEGGRALALGRALLLLEDPAGPRLPRGLCLTGLRGRLVAPVRLGPDGSFEWPLPGTGALDLPPLRALAWARWNGGSWVDALLSNAVQLPSSNPRRTGELPRVVISEFMKDPSFVSDAKGEWIELHNPTSAPIDVEGWVLSDHGSESTVLQNGGAGIVVPAGGFAVVGKEADPALNGDVPVDGTYSAFTLANGDDEIVLSLPGGTIVDELAYDDGVTWPDTPGRSIGLDPGHLDEAQNDDGSNWCHGSTPISGNNPDTGTPGGPNDPCG